MAKPIGWRNESTRHSLARRGIKTAQKIQTRPARRITNPYQNAINDVKNNKAPLMGEGGTVQVFKSGKYAVKVPIDHSLRNEDELRIEMEDRCEIIKLIEKELSYYPKCKLIDFYMVTQYLPNQNKQPIQTLSLKHKQQLADASKVLFEEGYVNFDLRSENVAFTQNDDAVVIDFGNVGELSPKELHREYNLQIISIFGKEDLVHARPYLTEKASDLGIGVIPPKNQEIILFEDR